MMINLLLIIHHYHLIPIIIIHPTIIMTNYLLPLKLDFTITIHLRISPTDFMMNVSPEVNSKKS